MGRAPFPDGWWWNPWEHLREPSTTVMHGPERVVTNEPGDVPRRPVGFTARLGEPPVVEPQLWEGDQA